MRYNKDKPSNVLDLLKEVGYMADCRCCGDVLITQAEKDRGVCRSCERLVSQKVTSERSNFPFLSRQFNTWEKNDRAS